MKKLVYQKYKIKRVTWFDESYAVFVDGRIKNMKLEDLYNLSQKLKPLQNIDMNILNNEDKIVTKEYNGYDMFLIVGKYIFDNHLQKEYIQKLINNRDDMIEIGKTILSKAIEYIENLYKKNKEKNYESII